MYYQQLQMLKNGTRACTDRIVRIFQSHVHPIVRGNPKFPAEFGAKIGASIVSWKSNAWESSEHFVLGTEINGKYRQLWEKNSTNVEICLLRGKGGQVNYSENPN